MLNRQLHGILYSAAYIPIWPAGHFYIKEMKDLNQQACK